MRSFGIDLPANLSTIGDAAFALCNGLQSIKIPASVCFIGDSAFAGCLNLKSVYFQGNPPAIGGNIFFTSSPATAYYLASASGWGPVFSTVPAKLFYPTIPLERRAEDSETILLRRVASLESHSASVPGDKM